MGFTLFLMLLVVIGGGFFVVSTYNGLIALIKETENAKTQIDVQLDRRYKVLSALIEVLKKQMDFEKSTLKEVVDLRNKAVLAKSSGDVKGQLEAEGQISQIASGINMVFEQYPDLKSDQNARHLQEEIVSTENKLSYSRQGYNDAVTAYETKRDSFFSGMVVGFFPKLARKFEMWTLSEEKRGEREDYEVKF